MKESIYMNKYRMMVYKNGIIVIENRKMVGDRRGESIYYCEI